MGLRLSSAHRQFLLDHARQGGPHEVCGLLAGAAGGDADTVVQLIPARNVAANPARSFEIDPATLLAAHRGARGDGQRIIGHWHSHPNGRPEPSKRDAARAVQNGQIWLIIAGDTLSAWRALSCTPGPARFVSVPLEIV